MLGAALLTALVTAIPMGSVPTDAAATTSAKTRLVRTDCCSVQAPAFLKFSTEDGQSEASYNGLKVTFGTEFYNEPHNLVGGTVDNLGGGKTSYRKEGKNYLVESGLLYDDETIFYVRASFDTPCKHMGVLTITYPETEKAKFSPTVSTLSKSFVSKNCP